MIQSATAFTTVGTTAVQVVPADPRRMVLTFFSNSNTRYTLSNSAGATIDNGPTIQQGSSPLTMDYETYGNVIRKPWFAVGPAAATPVCWIEGTGP